MPYHSDNQIQRGAGAAGRVAALKNLRKAPEQKLDDQSIQYTFGDCLKSCEGIPMPLSGFCHAGCLITNPFSSQPNLQISEKLAATANNLFVESKQLSSMADSLELMGI